MKGKSVWAVLLVVPLVWSLSCTKSDEESICHAAKEFATEYYGMNLGKACEYCVRDLHPMLRFREKEVTAEDLEAVEAYGPMKVRVLDCHIRRETDVAHVNVELRHFIRVNYLTGVLMKIECDTIRLTLNRQNSSRWLVNNPI